MAKHVGIIGGGILGMTLALRLAENGFKVTILEGAEATGGLASPCKIGDYTWDRFYHVILMSDSNLLELLEELDLRDHIHWGQTKTGFYTDGRLYSMSNIFEFIAFPPLDFLSKLRLGLTIFYASRIKSWKRLEQIYVENWLVRLSGRKTFKRIWLPLLKSKLGENYKVANAAFIWAIIARMYAARRTGMKQEMFGYVGGGYATILDRFRRRLDGIGVETLCRAPVSSVRRRNGHLDVFSSALGESGFDAVIATLPCNQLADLSPELSAAEKSGLQKVLYEGVVCAAVLLRKPLAGYYITNITDDWVPFTAVIEMTALVDKENFGGSSLVYLPRYVAQEDPLWTRSDDEIREEFLVALESMYSSFRFDDVVAFTVSRGENVLPITTLNYSSVSLPPTRTSLDHFYVVNSSQIPNGTMNLNEIVGLANRKSKELVEILSQSV